MLRLVILLREVATKAMIPGNDFPRLSHTGHLTARRLPLKVICRDAPRLQFLEALYTARYNPFLRYIGGHLTTWELKRASR